MSALVCQRCGGYYPTSPDVWASSPLCFCPKPLDALGHDVERLPAAEQPAPTVADQAALSQLRAFLVERQKRVVRGSSGEQDTKAWLAALDRLTGGRFKP